MTECPKSSNNIVSEPQCQFFVVRKKRLCRMTVRPGRQYCGEHEPRPQTDDGEVDKRIPCPNDSKHTCYASKLEKHLSICNARQVTPPDYIVHNINIPAVDDVVPRRLLSEVPQDTLMRVIDKVNAFYDKYLKDEIEVVPEQAIHPAVWNEFSEADRTESSRRHLRQTSSLLRLAERERLVHDQTCYAELGAGKGQLSYYAWSAWCSADEGSGVLLVDRASLRHKRDNKLRADGGSGGVVRVRADLAHVALHRVPLVQTSRRLVGLAKHLCGVATDYALRCLCAVQRTRGALLATCCHHRCLPHLYVGRTHLQELGINSEDLNVMLGVVSWATCGDGRSRQLRARAARIPGETDDDPKMEINGDSVLVDGRTEENPRLEMSPNGRSDREVAKKNGDESLDNERIGDSSMLVDRDETKVTDGRTDQVVSREECRQPQQDYKSQAWRAEVGRRAKVVVDWGRVLYLRQQGFSARLCQYVPAAVSPENVCILATSTHEQ